MACLLGIEDEALSQTATVDYTVNKVGGKPVKYICNADCVLNKKYIDVKK